VIPDAAWPWIWFGAKVAFVLNFLMTSVPVLVILERRISAFIQGRLGPNRVGPQGLLQPVADIVKFLLKEEIIPLRADTWLFRLGPLLVFVPPAVGFAVIPWGNQIGDEKLQVVNLDIGILFVMSVLSVGVYGIALGGWASNNKYSLLGSLRASAQLISYELSLGLTLLLAVMMTGSIDPQGMVAYQIEHGWTVFGNGSLLRLPLGIVGFLMMYTCSLAENNRLPFDMAECEAELVGGYHTEYSSMKFAMFMMGEYVAMVLMSGLITTLFLGGWHLPFVTDPADHSWLGGALSVGVFTAKVYAILFTTIWIRWTLPRFKYNQLMDLGWKALLPLALVNVAAMALIGVLVEG
jgi:NADH-quinone oxidoreductase subunit H